MVEILDETNRFRHADLLRRALSALIAELGESDRTVTVVVLDDDAMRERNREDRGVDATTDVLSYPTAEPDDIDMPPVEHLGDIFISLDSAVRQAAQRGHAPHTEMLVLAAHGLTHLRGLDHPTPSAWRPFRAAERRIVALSKGPA